jgi:DNA polymerase-3 subunit gamma/tau
VVTALYRRYRPDTFAEMIGQSQVTEPLMTALRTNRVNHAYLFSGPRGCGKTTSARILARCLNCAEGPTDTPCGKCSSCIELSRDGGGSLDVVEIDAASHNGVDDARDIRERAIFAPARDRYKIFILDEAHMVTPQGFNALLKIVEEPPEHVKFIFATTEPEKVIGTIRSRTHHYPFRLVPPAQMLDYVQSLCDTEGVTVAPGVLPLVVRAGGGSPRDTLSLLDQLMAGSDNDTVDYERAVALLGYTHAALLDEVIDAIAARDAAGAFNAVDRVVQTGQDPRRFVEDLLERLRDLIVVAATSAEGAAAVLRGIPQDELDRMSVQSMKFGAAELSRSADIVNTALTEMTGATSPRLHLELMIARVLVPSSDETERGALARVERLERRVGVSDSVGAGAGAAAADGVGSGASASGVGSGASASGVGSGASASSAVPRAAEIPQAPVAEPVRAMPPASVSSRESASELADAPAPSPAPSVSAGTAEAPDSVPVEPVGAVTTQQVKDAWPQILDAVQKAKRSAWMVVFTAQVRSLNGDVLTLSFPSDNDVASFRQPSSGGALGVSEYLRQAIVDVLGIRVKYIAKTDGAPAAQTGLSAPASPSTTASPSDRPAAATSPVIRSRSDQTSEASGPSAAAVTTEWAVASIPGGGAASAPAPQTTVATPTVPTPTEPASIAAAPYDDVPPPEIEPPDEPPVPEHDEEGWAVETGPGLPPRAPEASTASKPSAPTARATSAAPAGAAAASAQSRPAASAASSGGRTPTFQQPQRYGESVVREILGATFIEEQSAPPAGSR